MARVIVTDDEKQATRKEFESLVNMTPTELRRWLETPPSRTVGMTHEGGDESVGHQMGRHILEIKAKKQAELNDQDYAHMRKVIGYVHRHSKQRPKGDVTDTKWRYSLMNWGHDPAS